MIARAKREADGRLVSAAEAAENIRKGEFVCPYCGIPLVPVEKRFWRIYPEQEHENGYCRYISRKEGAVHNPAITGEVRFFTNERIPEPEYRHCMDGRNGLFGSVFDFTESREEYEKNELSQGTETYAGETLPAPGRGCTPSPAESITSQMSSLYDERFHESPLNTPMFAGTRGDYMCLPDNCREFLDMHNGRILGFKIIGATFSGYSRKDRTLFFDVYAAEGGMSEKSVYVARAEMQCPNEEYFSKVLLERNFLFWDSDSACMKYRYKVVHVWLRGNWKWFSRGDCPGCSRKTKTGCGSCTGMARSLIKTSAAILFTTWKDNNGTWKKRRLPETEPETVSLEELGKEIEKDNQKEKEM